MLSSITFRRMLTPIVNQVAKFGDKPALVAFYSRTAAKAFEPVGKEIGQVHYEVSLAQVLLKDLHAALKILS